MKLASGLAVAAVVMAIAGCTSHTSGNPAARSTPPTAVTSMPPTSPSPITTSAPPSSVSPTTPTATHTSTHSGIGQCGDNAFDVTAADQQGATGHSSVLLRFHNRLSLACTVFGYPGADAVSSSGAVLAHARRTLNGFAGGAHTIATLTVLPGGTVSAALEWMNFNPVTTGSCATSAAIDVTPANTAHTVRLPVHVTVCELQIHPTVAGTTGNG